MISLFYEEISPIVPMHNMICVWTYCLCLLKKYNDNYQMDENF